LISKEISDVHTVKSEFKIVLSKHLLDPQCP
jgi:hypothetical protein